MNDELIKTIVEYYKEKYPETTIDYTGFSIVVNGLHKAIVLLELQYFMNILAKSQVE